MLSLDRKPHRAEGIASIRDYYRWVKAERANPRSVMLERPVWRRAEEQAEHEKAEKAA